MSSTISDSHRYWKLDEMNARNNISDERCIGSSSYGNFLGLYIEGCVFYHRQRQGLLSVTDEKTSIDILD